ncbi:Acyl-CoA synthetase (AMP-forming)/AMP-acid ligase II [Micromonospora pattaloongensis]|uniref:Acyl-CoA synthetase (AMP-forming)/AMP-acid ligase II n=1 Tax=Micromonospora pattaloongensis TaxID=405436 RepID=A0A1H3R3H3_9ACTN|nr:AMP-binding protein [Micromonospora pattaloongensis]SDZ19851.1 Acyl-CoA synthetase (AMP-forming)/AMP-acid ligase II [Micromonospora pattaloongensis]
MLPETEHRDETVTGLLERIAATGTGELLVAETGERVPLADLLRISRTAAAQLRADGVRRGDPVGLVAENGLVFLRALLGILHAGAVAVPLAIPSAMGGVHGYVDHLRRVLTDSAMRHLVVSSACLRVLRARTAELPAVRLIDGDALPTTGSELAEPVSTDSLAVIQYTSGSTLRPRGVMLSHRNVVAGLDAIVDGCALTRTDVAGLWIPLFHDMGLFSTLAALVQGMRVVLWRPSTFVRRPAAWLEQFVDHGCTVTTAPNFFYDQLMDDADRIPKDLDLSTWRLGLNGAEPVQATTVDRFRGAFADRGLRPDIMVPVYGMAEATLAVTFARRGTRPSVLWLDRTRTHESGLVVPAEPGAPGARPLVAVGQAVRGVRIRIAGADGAEDRLGEIEIAGTPVTAGYFREPAGDLFTYDGWLRTGDEGFVHGGELYVAGRTKNIVVIRGHNYYAEDAEAIVRDLPGVYRRRCAAVGQDDERGERLVMVVETGIESSDERRSLTNRIRSEISAGLGLLDVAVQLIPPQSLPRTSSGKVQRAKVRASVPSVP